MRPSGLSIALDPNRIRRGRQLRKGEVEKSIACCQKQKRRQANARLLLSSIKTIGRPDNQGSAEGWDSNPAPAAGSGKARGKLPCCPCPARFLYRCQSESCPFFCILPNIVRVRVHPA